MKRQTNSEPIVGDAEQVKSERLTWSQTRIVQIETQRGGGKRGAPRFEDDVGIERPLARKEGGRSDCGIHGVGKDG